MLGRNFLRVVVVDIVVVVLCSFDVVIGIDFSEVVVRAGNVVVVDIVVDAIALGKLGLLDKVLGAFSFDELSSGNDLGMSGLVRMDFSDVIWDVCNVGTVCIGFDVVESGLSGSVLCFVGVVADDSKDKDGELEVVWCFRVVVEISSMFKGSFFSFVCDSSVLMISGL